MERVQRLTSEAQSKPAFNAASTLITVGSGLHLIAEIRTTRNVDYPDFTNFRALPVQADLGKIYRNRVGSREIDVNARRTEMRIDPRHFADPLAMFLNDVANVHDVETVLLIPNVDYGLDDVHVIRRIVEDLDLVEIVAGRHD